MERATLREIKNLPLRQFEQVINQTIDEQIDKSRGYHYTHAWTSLFLAFCDRFPLRANKQTLNSMAVDTLRYVNGIEPASELASWLQERTGFDIYAKPSDCPLPYVEPGLQDEAEARPWASLDEAPRSYKFYCPHCGAVAYYPQLKQGPRSCPYRYCPTCGQPTKAVGA